MDCNTPGLSCLSPAPGIQPNSCPSSRWCHSTISVSAVPFSSCVQSCPASGSFPVTQFVTSGGQSNGALASVLPVNIQGWFPLGFPSLISCCPKDSQKSSPAPQLKSINSLGLSLLYGPTPHLYMATEKPYGPLLAKCCLCFLKCCLGLSLLFFQGASIF